MLYRLAVEDMEPNHWIAWALDLPGCFSSAQTQGDAAARAPGRIADYYAWLASHDSSLPLVPEPAGVQVVETFRAFASKEAPEYLVNAFFEDDRRLLSYWDIVTALRLLDWSRQDLLNLTQALPQDQLRAKIGGDYLGSVAELLIHIAAGENWYYNHFGLGLPWAQLAQDPFERVQQVRANTRAVLPKLIASDRIVEAENETWSARKILRRTLWHERDHTLHITQLLSHL